MFEKRRVEAQAERAALRRAELEREVQERKRKYLATFRPFPFERSAAPEQPRPTDVAARVNGHNSRSGVRDRDSAA